MFDKINLAKDNIYKDWQRALEKKQLKAAMLMMKIGQIPNYAVILWGFNIFWPLEQHGVAKQWGFLKPVLMVQLFLRANNMMQSSHCYPNIKIWSQFYSQRTALHLCDIRACFAS